jgi:hypothetical protein
LSWEGKLWKEPDSSTGRFQNGCGEREVRFAPPALLSLG